MPAIQGNNHLRSGTRSFSRCAPNLLRQSSHFGVHMSSWPCPARHCRAAPALYSCGLRTGDSFPSRLPPPSLVMADLTGHCLVSAVGTGVPRKSSLTSMVAGPPDLVQNGFYLYKVLFREARPCAFYRIFAKGRLSKRPAFYILGHFCVRLPFRRTDLVHFAVFLHNVLGSYERTKAGRLLWPASFKLFCSTLYLNHSVR